MWRHIRHSWDAFHKDELGVTVIEYALIILATAVALIAVMPGVGSKVETFFQDVSSGFDSI